MNEHEQRIAVAEVCGYERTDTWISGWMRRTPEHPTGFPCGLPDYLNDLNAMREAWQIDPPLPFTDSFNFRCELAWQLELIVTRDYDAKPFWKDRPFPALKEQIWAARNYWMIHATARQRAEAFLRTIGKWKD